MWRCTGALLSAWLCLCAAEAGAQEWTRFRGPNGAGQSDADFPAVWSPADVKFRVELPGTGNSSPVLWQNRVFVTSADAAQGQRWLLCLDATNGRLLWKQEFPFQKYQLHTQNSFASSTPTVDAKRVYCSWATPDEYFVVALDHDGKEKWRRSLGPFTSRHGFATSPMLYNDLLIATNDQDGSSTLQALDTKDGAIRWQVARKTLAEQNASYAVPCVYQPAKGPAELIVNSWAHGISSIDPKTGSTNWEVPAFERRPVGSPVIIAGLILGNCGEGSGNNTLVAVRPGPSPEIVYKLDKTTAPYVPTIVAAGDLAFLWGERGIAACLEVPTGKILWRRARGRRLFRLADSRRR